MYKNIELLKQQLTDEENLTIEIYEFINRKFIQKNYKIEIEKFKLIIDYFKTDNNELLDILWYENSIQKLIFIFCIELLKNMKVNSNMTSTDILNIIKLKVKNNFLKEFLITIHLEIFKLYLYNKKYNIDNIYFYEDDSFKIFYINSENYFKIKKTFDIDEVFFHIVTDGLININNNIITKGEGYFSTTQPLFENIKSIVFSSKIVIAIKKSMLENLSIDFQNYNNKKFCVYNLKFFNFIINKEKITNYNYFKVFQIINYLIEVLKNEKINIVDTTYFEYKQIITDIIENNIFEEDKEIIRLIEHKLLLSIPTIYKIFKILFLESPKKYIEQKKLNLACYYLSNSNDSIEKIATKLNYSRKIFFKKFQEFSGYNPIEFRKITELNRYEKGTA